MNKKIKSWNLFVAEEMNKLVELESNLRRLETEVRDAHLVATNGNYNEAQRRCLAQLCTNVDAIQDKLGDAIRTLFQLDLNERKCEAFIKFQLANGNWESDFLR